MAYARSSFGKRGGPVTTTARPRAQAARASEPEAAPDTGSNQPSIIGALFSSGDFGFADFHAQPAAWICGGIIALMTMTVVLTFGFGFGTLVRSHDVAMEAISGFVMVITASLAMAGAVFGGSLMAEAGKRHDLRFALLILVFAVELILFLVGLAIGWPKGVTWLLAGAILGGLMIWTKLKQDRLFASVAELTAGTD